MKDASLSTIAGQSRLAPSMYFVLQMAIIIATAGAGCQTPVYFSYEVGNVPYLRREKGNLYPGDELQCRFVKAIDAEGDEIVETFTLRIPETGVLELPDVINLKCEPGMEGFAIAPHLVSETGNGLRGPAPGVGQLQSAHDRKADRGGG